jgi:cobalt-zinc-cadmium efflux system outer membrane protein
LIMAALVLLAGCATYHPRPISPVETAAAFDTRSLTNEGLRAFLETNHVAAPAPGDAWNLKALTLIAFYYQPTLGEARGQVRTAMALTSGLEAEVGRIACADGTYIIRAALAVWRPAGEAR